MRREELERLCDEWIKKVEANETDRTFCTVDIDVEDDVLPTDYKLVGFNMDKEKAEEFINTYGRGRDCGRAIVTSVMDLSIKRKKKAFDRYFKDGILFGDYNKLERFH